MQGEGFHSGTPAIFVRFSGCNLWSGIDKDRENAVCKFCDTDFVGTDGQNGGKYLDYQLLNLLQQINDQTKCSFLIFTGGEPTLQLDTHLINLLKDSGFYITIETNGTNKVPKGLDWITVSPKEGSVLTQKTGHELKLVFPQDQFHPEQFIEYNFENFYLQPKYDTNYVDNLKTCLDYCLANPGWKLSMQLHKYLNIP